jgi:NAD(P)-dependent dehydrogenase (short-subunit alcohol dehydrogenase family)
VFGYINLTRLVHADMKARNNGVIVNIIGAAGERFNYDYITGSTGNAALMAFTKSLGGKSLHYGVRAVGINPGPVATDRHVYLMKTRARNELGDENRYSELLKDLPLGRAANPREIADMAAFLASDRSTLSGGQLTVRAKVLDRLFIFNYAKGRQPASWPITRRADWANAAKPADIWSISFGYFEPGKRDHRLPLRSPT